MRATDDYRELEVDELPGAELAVAPNGRPLSGRHRRGGFWHRTWRTWTLATVGVIAALLSVTLVSGTAVSVQWMETPAFCGQCHTMKPELAAYARSPHRTVNCAECHVAKGVTGLIEAKINGTNQLIELANNSFPRPIPPAAHKMDKVAENCLDCHREAPSRKDLLVLKQHFQEDERNTEQRLALVVKLADGTGDRDRGIHWHARSRLEFVPRDASERQIDFVRVTEPDGTVKEFASRDLLARLPSEPEALSQAKSSAERRQLTCLTCHNRVGHEFLAPDQALDVAIADGRVDRSLPFVKKQGVALLGGAYATTDEADAAIGGLGDYYRQNYPAVYEKQSPAIDRAAAALKDLYAQVATPEMSTTYRDYPSFLGHQESSGCYRCHDGAHFQVQDGRPTTEIIPFNCSLCHTFPQTGDSISSVTVGAPPADHSAKRWITEHESAAVSTEVSRTTCSACHSQSYCTNCHSTRLVHTNMLYDHAAAIRVQGTTSCAICHQRPFCLRCHEKEAAEGGVWDRQGVLPGSTAR